MTIKRKEDEDRGRERTSSNKRKKRNHVEVVSKHDTGVHGLTQINVRTERSVTVL